MSAILDALRRGHARVTPPRPNPGAAHTDAVLQTFGYTRFNPAAPVNRLRRLVGYLLSAVVFAITLWTVAVWSAQASTARRPLPPSAKARPASAETHNNLGVLYREKGLLDAAARHFQRAIAIDPRDTRARNNLGLVLVRQRRFAAAAIQFHAALATDPKSIEALVNLSTVEKESGRRDRARTWLVRALEIDGRSADAHYNLARLEDEAGNAPDAVTHYRAFLQCGATTRPALVKEVQRRLEEILVSASGF